MLTLLPQAPRASLAAAFLGYRLIYYVVPLALAAIFIARTDVLRRPSARRMER